MRLCCIVFAIASLCLHTGAEEPALIAQRTLSVTPVQPPKQVPSSEEIQAFSSDIQEQIKSAAVPVLIPPKSKGLTTRHFAVEPLFYSGAFSFNNEIDLHSGQQNCLQIPEHAW